MFFGLKKICTLKFSFNIVLVQLFKHYVKIIFKLFYCESSKTKANFMCKSRSGKCHTTRHRDRKIPFCRLC